MHASRVAATYHEVSALTGDGVEELMKKAGRAAVAKLLGTKDDAGLCVKEGRKRAKLKKRRLF